mgnify:CR=1 FL=1
MLYRFLEMIPGMLAWGTLIAIVLVSWWAPVAAAFFIILFDTYWLLKTIYLSLHLSSTFRKLRENMLVDWLEKLKEGARMRDPRLAHWQEVYHLVILPMYQEPYEVVRESFESLARSHYPKEKLIVALGTEERAGEGRLVAERIQKEFGAHFFKLILTIHPSGLAGEIPGKGSNESWAAKEAVRTIIDPYRLAYENVIVSVFDSDTQVFPEYFGMLTHQFLMAPHPQRSSFQPIPFFTNNIFSAPALARVISFSSTFWQMIQQSRPERLTTFSSHSMSLKALVEVGFWNTNVVSEDSQIFWQCFLHYDGDWRVVPIFYPVSMDANVAPTFWGTMRNIYRQQRRWGWGCENVPYLLYGFIKNKKIPLRKKIYWGFIYIEGFHSWATNALMIFTMGWLPIFLGGSAFRVSILSYNLPRVVQSIMWGSMLGIASSSVLSMILLPPKPAWFRPRHYMLYSIQWLLMPITLIAFGAFPGIEAQTRLLFGGKWRLGFWVTPKYR